MKNLRKNGISRIWFFVFVIIWFVVGVILNRIEGNMAYKWQSEGATLLFFLLLIIHTIFLAVFVYYRHKNANIKHRLAVVLSFIPILQIAPIISGLWYKQEGSKGFIEPLKEKYSLMDTKGIFLTIGVISAILTVGAGYIYNIVWLFDNWHILETLTKFINVGFMIFIPPFGGLLGIYHFFI